MAEKLKQFPARHNVGRPVGSKYDKYLDGNVWKLQQGIDFEGAPERFIRAIRQHANNRRDLGLSAMIDGDTVIVQSKPKGK
jgi:hypothetical protein